MNLVFQVLVLATLWSCAGDKPAAETVEAIPTPEVSGKMNFNITISGAGNDVAKLLGVFGNQNYLVDSAKSDATGNFVFTADTLLPKGFYYVMLASDNSYFQLLLGSDQEFSLSTTKGDYVNSMQVDGDTDNDLLYRNLQFESEFGKRLAPVNQQLEKLSEGTSEYARLKSQQDKLVAERKAHIASYKEQHSNSFFTEFKISGQNPELTSPKLPSGEIDQATQIYRYRKAFFEGVDFNADWTMRTPVYANKLRRYIRELTPQNADSLIKYSDELISQTKENKELFKFTVNWIALEYKTPKTMGTEALYVHMIDTYWTKDLAWWSNDEEIKGLRGEVNRMKPSLIGKIGQDINVENERGETVSLYGLQTPIKVLFIYSYDCEHCQEEAPDMARVYQEWKDKGVGVMALCLNEDKSQWLDFVNRYGITSLENAFDPNRDSRFSEKYHIDITPELYVLDKNNRIIASNLSPNQLPDFLEGERAKNPW